MEVISAWITHRPDSDASSTGFVTEPAGLTVVQIMQCVGVSRQVLDNVEPKNVLSLLRQAGGTKCPGHC